MSDGGVSLGPLQVAVHGALIANAPLLAFLAERYDGGEPLPADPVPIFDEVPKNFPHDYLVHGDAQETKDDTFKKAKRTVDFAVEHWSLYRGSVRCKRACTLIADALNGAIDATKSEGAPPGAILLTVQGWLLSKIIYTKTIIQRQGDGFSRYGAAWFRAWLTEV